MCEHCNLVNCPVLNKAECPINILWAEADRIRAETEAAIKEAEAIIGD